MHNSSMWSSISSWVFGSSPTTEVRSAFSCNLTICFNFSLISATCSLRLFSANDREVVDGVADRPSTRAGVSLIINVLRNNYITKISFQIEQRRHIWRPISFLKCYLFSQAIDTVHYSKKNNSFTFHLFNILLSIKFKLGITFTQLSNLLIQFSSMFFLLIFYLNILLETKLYFFLNLPRQAWLHNQKQFVFYYWVQLPSF